MRIGRYCEVGIPVVTPKTNPAANDSGRDGRLAVPIWRNFVQADFCPASISCRAHDNSQSDPNGPPCWNYLQQGDVIPSWRQQNRTPIVKRCCHSTVRESILRLGCPSCCLCLFPTSSTCPRR